LEIWSQEIIDRLKIYFEDFYEYYSEIFKTHDKITEDVKKRIKKILHEFGLSAEESINLPWSEDFQINHEFWGNDITDQIWKHATSLVEV